MPNIAQYTNPIEGLQPTDRGTEAAVAAGRRSNASFNEAASAVRQTGEALGHDIDSTIKIAGGIAEQYVTNREISQGSLADTALTAKKTNDWNQLINGYTDENGVQHPKADPQDPGVQARFMDGLEQDLTKFRDGFTSERARDWAERHIEGQRRHFFNKTTTELASMAGDAVATNDKQRLNLASNTAMSDPASVDRLIAQWKSGTDAVIDSSPYLKGATGVHLKTVHTEAGIEQIVKAGAIGAIRSSADPEKMADIWSSKYPAYIKGAEVKQLADEARRQTRLNRAEDRAERAEMDRQNRDNYYREANKLELDSTRQNPTTGAMEPFTPPNAKARLNALSDMPGADKQHIATMVRRLEEVGSRSDENSARNLNMRSRTTQAELYGRMVDGSLTNKKDIGKAYLDGNLTWGAKQQLEADFDADRSATGQKIAQRRAEVIKAMEVVIDPTRKTMGSRSELGDLQLDRYQQWLREKEEEARKDGKKPQSIYDYDKDGNSVALTGGKQFSVSLNASLKSRLDAMRPTNNLTGPGKTITGISIEDVPPQLRSIPGLVGNPTTHEYYDPKTKKFYDKSGNPK